MNTFRIVSVNRSDQRGVPKTPVASIELQVDLGVVGDAHSGPGLRQVSLLAREDMDALNREGARLTPGDFAENVTTAGIALHELPLGATLRMGEAVLEVVE